MIDGVEIEGMYLSAGLVAVSRDGDGLMLDFASHEDPRRALRVALHLSSAPRMLEELRRLVALLEQHVPSDTSTARH